MYEYKIEKAKNVKDAEVIMNEMAKEGWRVVSTRYWAYLGVYLVLTFEREKK